MYWLVIILLLALLVWQGINWSQLANQQLTINRGRLSAGVTVLLLWMFGIGPAFGIVPAGNRGVVLRFGAVTGEILGEGLYILIPFVNSVELMNVQILAYPAKAVEAASHDLQTIHTDVVVNYRLDPTQAAVYYQQFRHEGVDRILFPNVQETVKSVTANYEAEKLITNRSRVKEEIDRILVDRISRYHLIVEAVSITNFDFSDEFEKSIEQKVIAEQLALKAKNDLVRITTEADQRIAQATGEAEAIRIRGDALRQNSQLVALEAVQRWDGKLPVTMLGDTVPFIQIPR